MTEPKPDLGIAGASARRQAERMRKTRDARTRERHPRMGATLLRFQSEPAAERRWNEGAEGEEVVAAAIRRSCPEVVLLCDRRVPGARANIDLIAVTPTGVWIIDPKRYAGQIRVGRDRKLRIGGRDRSKLIAGLDRQVLLVREALASLASEVSVNGCLCFVAPKGAFQNVGLPLMRTLRCQGYPLFYSRRLIKRLNAVGRISEERRAEIASHLASALRAA